MHAMRKYDEPKKMNVTKIVPDMGVLGPLFKKDAGKIKQKLEEMEYSGEEKISVELDGKEINIPENAYKIVEKEEKVTGEKFVPHVIEPSFGIDRIFYCILEHNYCETKKKGEEYTVLKLKPNISPIKAGVFPLINDDKLVKIAKDIYKELRKKGIYSYYDKGGSIGRRYARMDEAGTPYCITVDHGSLRNNTVTVRYRDSTKQERIKIDEVSKFLIDL